MTAANFARPPGDRKRPFVFRLLRGMWRLAFDASYRNYVWLQLRRPEGLFQPFSLTWTDRYPRIFSFAQGQFAADSEIRILSLGCSTGEEVFTLRKYFPQAFIKGIDISPRNIAVCRRRQADAKLSFAVADTTAAEPTAAFDAIFCMAVLRHGELARPDVTRCDHLIRFEDFARSVADFTRCLKPGGLLVIRHSNFRLCDTPSGADFETLLAVKLKRIVSPIFGPDNRLMRDVDYPDAVFRKKL